MNKVEQQAQVKGMSCVSCQYRIEEALRKTEGMMSIEVDYAFGLAKFSYDEEVISIERISEILHQQGYELNLDLGKEHVSIFFYLKSIALIASLALIFDKTIGFRSLPIVTRDMSFGMLFVVGIVTSLHCVAMCGGIGLSQSVKKKTDAQGSIKENMMPSLYYNLGRVVSYTMLGGIVGGLGSILSLSMRGKSLISIFAGLCMMLMGMNMFGFLKPLARFLPRLPKTLVRALQKKKRKKTPFLVGLLHGFMPCGPLQAMQVYALGTGTFYYGALSMFLFSIGTLPLMLLVGVFGSFLTSKLAHKVYQLGAMFVLLLGIMMSNRGLLLSGIDVVGKMSSAVGIELSSSTLAVMKGDYQEVRTTIQAGKYPPITVYQGIPVRWIITASAEDLNGCNNELLLPEYRHKVILAEGETVIEFIPEKAGDFVYTCWMGMITGNIRVQAV